VKVKRQLKRWSAAVSAIVLALGASACAEDAPGSECIGQNKPATATAPVVDACPTCVGSPLPQVVLQDVQPDSAEHCQWYDLASFQGRTTVVALFAAW